MKICWFGIYNHNFSRNKVYIKGLRENGVSIFECRDMSRGPLKYIRLFLKHWKIRNDYDFLVVGYPGHPVVWLAQLISHKPVVFDALCTLEEGVLISRKQRGMFSLKAFYIRFIDWLGVACADLVLVETEAQRKYFIKKFGLYSDACKVVYIGANSEAFYSKPDVKKKDIFTVLFRGQFLPEAGVRHVIDMAKLLENKDIDVLVVGNGFLLQEIQTYIQRVSPKNLELITRSFSQDELRELMLPCHVALGQLENHERLSRTIPHKCFESLAVGIAYVNARTEPLAEILVDGESALFVNPADPQDLVEKIMLLKNDPVLRNTIAENGHKVYEERFTPKILGRDILNILESYKQ